MQSEGYIMNVPNGVAYCFDPCIVYVQGTLRRIGGVEVTVGSVKVDYKSRENRVVADIEELVQSQFKEEEMRGAYYGLESSDANTGKLLTFTVRLYDDKGETVKTSTNLCYFIWGSLYQGEKPMDVRNVTWFKGYPFVFNVLRYGGKGGIRLIMDGQTAVNIANESVGIYNYSIPGAAQGARSYIDVYNYVNEEEEVDEPITIKSSAFDNTFDKTYKQTATLELTGDEAGKRLHIDIGTCQYENPIYLRWIDRHGFLCHWLFRGAQEKKAVTVEEGVWRSELKYWEQDKSLMGTQGRRRAYGRTDTITAVAPMVSREQHKWLQNIATSPMVDIYLKEADEWVSVTVNAGTYTYQPEVPLQDFVVEVIREQYNLQRL